MSIKTTINLNFQDTKSSLNELKKTIEDINNNPDKRIVSIEIIGATSPDGNYVCNKRLAQNRAKTILNYLQDSFDLSSFSVNVDSKNIDWDGLTSLVEASNMAHRDDALQILHNTPEWIYSNGVIVDGRRHQLGMLKGGLPYNYMSKNFFEKLRYACVDIKYSSKETGAVKEDEPIKQEKADEVIDLKVVEEIKPKEEASVSPITEITKDKKPFYMALKTNMLYDLALVPNIGAEFYLGKGWTINGSCAYAWWTKDPKHLYWRVYGGELGVRKYFGN